MTKEMLSHFLLQALPFFERIRDTGLPLMMRFPNGSCEPTSAIFAMALAKRFPESEVCVVKSCSNTGDIGHFWVEIDGFVADPTAHQFDGYKVPFATTMPSPLEKIFPFTQRITIASAISALSELNYSATLLKLLGNELLEEVESRPQFAR
jgi:hypothetical protein